MMMSVWTRAVETEADVQTTGFVDDSAVRSKRGKTRDQAMTNLRQAWEVSKEFGSKAGTKCNRKKVKMIASDVKTEKEMEREFEQEELKCTKAFVLVGGTMTTCTTSSKKKQAKIREINSLRNSSDRRKIVQSKVEENSSVSFLLERKSRDKYVVEMRCH